MKDAFALQAAEGVMYDIQREEGYICDTWSDIAFEWMGPVETDMMHKMDEEEDWYEVYVLGHYGPTRLHYATAPKSYGY